MADSFKVACALACHYRSVALVSFRVFLYLLKNFAGLAGSNLAGSTDNSGNCSFRKGNAFSLIISLVNPVR